MVGHPRLIIAFGDSRIGGFGASRTGARFAETITGSAPLTSLAKRWTDPAARFDINTQYNTADPWTVHTDTQNLQGTGTIASYGIARTDGRMKPSGQSRYIVFFSGSGSQTSNQNVVNPLGTWDPQVSGGLFDLFTQGYLLPVLSLLPRPIELGGVYFTLGGGDGRTLEAANDYTAALTRVLLGLETVLGIAQLPCVADIMPTPLDTTLYPHQNIVRAQQQHINANVTTGPLAKVYFENSDHLPRIDPVHWTHDGALVAGINMCKRMLTAVNPPGTEPLIL